MNKENQKKICKGEQKAQKGITLIALVITIIVMLVLVAVTISMAVNGGLFNYAGKAVEDTQKAINAEQELANGRIEIGGVWYDDIDSYIAERPSANQGQDEILTAPEVYVAKSKVGENITVYVVENAEETEKKGSPVYDLLFVGTGVMGDWVEHPECVFTPQYDEYGYVYDYSGKGNINNVKISKGITNVSSSVLGCKNIIIPSTVTRIGDSAFSGCTGLTSITIPSSVTSIGYRAFFGCTGLTSITIPSSVTSIESYAFYNTPWYNNQENGEIYIGKVFYKYKGTMEENTNIILKEGTIHIASDAFKGCSGLTNITLPNTLIDIGSSAFNGCTGLTSITIPKNVAKIGVSAFYNCTGLETVNYTGSEEEWNLIDIVNYNGGNYKLTNNKINYNYSE